MKGAGNEEKQMMSSKNAVDLTSGGSLKKINMINFEKYLFLSTYVLAEGASQDALNEDDPENNPQFTTVYVGNLSTEVSEVESNLLV